MAEDRKPVDDFVADIAARAVASTGDPPNRWVLPVSALSESEIAAIVAAVPDGEKFFLDDIPDAGPIPRGPASEA